MKEGVNTVRGAVKGLIRGGEVNTGRGAVKG